MMGNVYFYEMNNLKSVIEEVTLGVILCVKKRQNSFDN